jgi:hypothetical protein
VILRGAAWRSPIREAFTRAQLLDKHGSEVVPFATLPYAGSFGVAAYRVPLSKVAAMPPPPTVALSPEDARHHLAIMKEAALAQRNTTATTAAADVGVNGEAAAAAADAKEPTEEPPLYAFTTLSPAFRTALNVVAPLPPFLTEVLLAHAVAAGDLQEPPPDPDDVQFLSPAQMRSKQLRRALAGTDHFASHVETQFYLGPEGSGAPGHFHTHALNTLAYGEKRWFLFPPSEAFYSTKPALEFARSDPRAAAALQVTQRAGDVLYVPSLWGHATLNLRQSVGVAHEFTLEGVCFV